MYKLNRYANKMKSHWNGMFLEQNRCNFFSFSNFEIFTCIFQTFINLLLNRVYRQSRRSILKNQLKILEKLKEHKKLENRPTLDNTGKMRIIPYTVPTNTNRPYRNNSLHRIAISLSVGSKYSKWQDQRIPNYMANYIINEIYSNILSKWKVKIFHMQTIPNQWITKK